MAGLNQEIDFDCASLIAEEFGKIVVLETPEITEENEILSLDYEDKKRGFDNKTSCCNSNGSC